MLPLWATVLHALHVNNQQLARQQTFKYLGITFSENLNWSDYLTDVSTKINQRIGLLRRVKAFLSVKDRLTMYNSLILLLFDYADIIWGDKNNSTLMDQLQILQNKTAKTILDVPLLSSSTEALSKLHWHPLTYRRFLHRMVTIFKLNYNLIDCDFDLPKINHLYNTRQRDHIHLSKPNTNWGKQRLLYHACKEYNDLDNNIKSIKELHNFYNALLKSPKY